MKRPESFLDPALLGERHAEVKVRPADRRIKLNGFTKILDARLNITPLRNQLTKITIGVCVIWKKLDRFLEISSGQIESALGGTLSGLVLGLIGTAAAAVANEIVSLLLRRKTSVSRQS